MLLFLVHNSSLFVAAKKPEQDDVMFDVEACIASVTFESSCCA